MTIRDKDQAGTGIRFLTVDANGNHGNQAGPLLAPSTDFSAFISGLGTSTSYSLTISTPVTLTANLTIPSNISLVVLNGGTIGGAYTLTINGDFEAGAYTVFVSSITVRFDPESVDFVWSEWWGAKADNLDASASLNYTAIYNAIHCFQFGYVPRVKFRKGTYKYNQTIDIDAYFYGARLTGVSKFSTILKYIGAGSGWSSVHAGDGNGITHWTFEDIELDGNGTGTNCFDLGIDAATIIPDVGIVSFYNVRINNWTRHGWKNRMSLGVSWTEVEVLNCGGHAYFNPYAGSNLRSTTTTLTRCYFHGNSGYGICIDRNQSFKVQDCTLDSNFADDLVDGSTHAEVIGYAGYTITLSSFLLLGVPQLLQESDLGLTIRRTRSAVTTDVGTLASYSNSRLEWVINALVIMDFVVGDTYAIVSGTAGTGSASAVKKNGIGVYARNVVGLQIDGGHYENHLLNFFTDNCTSPYICPAYVLTQGAGAWAAYFGSTTTRPILTTFAHDVQTGGFGGVYSGPNVRHLDADGFSGAYAWVIESLDYWLKKGTNAGSSVEIFNSTAVVPSEIIGHHANGLMLYLNSTVGTGNPVAGLRFQTNVSPGYVRDFVINKDGDVIFSGPASARRIGFLGSNTDRADLRLFWGTSDGESVWDIGPGTSQMTGSDVGADFNLAGYDDAGANPYTAISIIRATRLASIMAGKSASTRANIGGTIFQSVVSVGNSGASETDLWNYSVPANMLARNGDAIRVTFGGATAANANGKRFKVYFGGTTGMNTGSLALNAAQWSMEVFIQRLTATTQLLIVKFFSNNAILYTYSETSSPAETLSGAVTLRATATATTTNDVVSLGAQGKWEPGA